jgi:hypothetical protein
MVQDCGAIEPVLASNQKYVLRGEGGHYVAGAVQLALTVA